MLTLTDLLPNIYQLHFLDKIRLIRILAEDIDVSNNKNDKVQTYFDPSQTYYLHTPQFETGAADILMQALQASQEN